MPLRSLAPRHDCRVGEQKSAISVCPRFGDVPRQVCEIRLVPVARQIVFALA